MRVVGFLFLLG